MKFSYEGHTRSGVPKMGEIEADSEEEASAKLRKKDIFVMSMKPEGEEHKMVLEHGKVPEEEDDHLLDLEGPQEAPESLDDELKPESNLDEPKPKEKRHKARNVSLGSEHKREPFGANATLGGIRHAMRVAGIWWDSQSGEWFFQRVTFDAGGNQVSQWLPESLWKAHRSEDARAAYQLSQIIKSATERAGKATLE